MYSPSVAVVSFCCSDSLFRFTVAPSLCVCLITYVTNLHIFSPSLSLSLCTRYGDIEPCTRVTKKLLGWSWWILMLEKVEEVYVVVLVIFNKVKKMNEK
jgi:hypothetical protein